MARGETDIAGRAVADSRAPSALAIARYRRRNAVKAVNDALVELRVADRKIRELEARS